MILAIIIVVCGHLAPTAIGLVGFCSSLPRGHRLQGPPHHAGAGTHLETDVTDEEIATRRRYLPMYTILVPLYKEAAVVPRLVRDINAGLPRTPSRRRKLCEEDDQETVNRIREMHLPPHFHLVVVPDSQPKTKPKACNYGSSSPPATVIFDAGTVPTPTSSRGGHRLHPNARARGLRPGQLKPLQPRTRTC